MTHRIMRPLRRLARRLWYATICAPTFRPKCPPGPPPRCRCVNYFAKGFGPHPLQHDTVQVTTADPDEAWSTIAGTVV